MEIDMTDLSHLHALELNLSHERVRLFAAKSDGERKLRAVWVRALEKEIEAEYKFLGIEPEVLSDEDLADLLADF
jgi:hypothetical protein